MLTKKRTVFLNIQVGRETTNAMAVAVARELVRRGHEGHITREKLNAKAAKVIKELELMRIAIDAIAAKVADELVRIGFIKVVDVRTGVMILPEVEIDEQGRVRRSERCVGITR